MFDVLIKNNDFSCKDFGVIQLKHPIKNGRCFRFSRYFLQGEKNVATFGAPRKPHLSRYRKARLKRSAKKAASIRTFCLGCNLPRRKRWIQVIPGIPKPIGSMDGVFTYMWKCKGPRMS